MKIRFINSYPALNEDGTAKQNSKGKNLLMFRYSVHGTDSELKEYKTAQGGDNPAGDNNHYREDENGTPLYFTSRGCGKSGILKISPKGKVFIDTSDLDMLSSMIENYGAETVSVYMKMSNSQSNVKRSQIEQTDESLD